MDRPADPEPVELRVRVSGSLGVTRTLGFRVSSFGADPESAELRVRVSGFEFWGKQLWFRVSNFRFWDSGFGFRIPGSGVRVLRSELRVSSVELGLLGGWVQGARLCFRTPRV